MDDAPVTTSPAPANRPIWQRPVSRRVVLATGATGAAAAAMAVLWKGNDLSQILNHVRDLTHGYQGALSSERVRVAHLLRRAGFGATKTELDHFAALGQSAAAEALLNYSKTSNAALESQLPTIDLTTGTQPTAAAIQGWWLQRMVETTRPLEEKMTLFWHGLLTSGLDKAGTTQMFTQNQLYRSLALGNFDALLKAVSKDPAMMVYLDTETNRKGKPNENYARELMELFTTGIGHYTEDDVRESARAFTGWTLPGAKQLRYATTSVFVARLHDASAKTFMGKTGNFTGDDIVEMLVPLRATAVRLTSRLFSFFAYPNPEPAIVNHLADTFQKSRYNVGAVVREILTMDAFYSDKAYRALVKTPVELVAQTLKATGATTKGYTAAAGAMGPMGQVLFYPPNVAGWPGGTSWINSSTLLNRINFANAATVRSRTTLPTQPLAQLSDTLIDANASAATRDGLQAFAAAHPTDQAGLLFMVLATPEFQLN
ncbi:MAG TPA: DUF1800 domain-containing protein [Candidatus Dormibacteraeota bacterium]|nr:DUF1800 domain-containing protein [Candidatus Dormibacteraeota bacterium]